jgi:hypothetical protein
VTLVEETTNPAPSGNPEALFPEARQRRRRIRLTAGVIVLVLALTTGGIVYGVDGHSAPPKTPSRPPVSTAPKQIAPNIVVRSTENAESAQESWRSTDGAPGCYPTLSGNGVINLVRPGAAVTVTESGCLPGGSVGANEYRVVQIGGARFETRQPHEADSFSGKTWLKIPASAGDFAHLATDQPLLVLNAVEGPLQRVGTAYIRGVPTTEYRGSATLQSLQTATHFVNYGGPFGTPDPPLNRIPVYINVWIDGSNRLRRVSTWQPQYVLYFTDGSSEGGPYLVAPTTGTPKGPPRQKGYEATSLDLWNFGTPAWISPPPARTVVQPKR